MKSAALVPVILSVPFAAAASIQGLVSRQTGPVECGNRFGEATQVPIKSFPGSRNRYACAAECEKLANCVVYAFKSDGQCKLYDSDPAATITQTATNVNQFQYNLKTCKYCKIDAKGKGNNVFKSYVDVNAANQAACSAYCGRAGASCKSYAVSASTCYLFKSTAAAAIADGGELLNIRYFDPSCVVEDFGTPATAPATCSNVGFEFAHFDQPYGGVLTQQIVASYFKTKSPNYVGAGSTFGPLSGPGNVGDVTSFYGSPPLASDLFALLYRGYIFARTTGAYTFTTTNPDDLVFLWGGEKARSGWTGNAVDIGTTFSGNYDLVGTWYNPYTGVRTVTLNLIQGEYYPYRILLGQAGGGYNLDFSIADASGTVIQSSTVSSPWALQKPCSGTTFSAFGSES